jgi:hypothetical protein
VDFYLFASNWGDFMTAIKWIAALVLGLGLLAGCDGLSSIDDPRNDDAGSDGSGSGVDDSGSCSGSSISCSYRADDKCNSGCTIADACSLGERNKCAAITSPDLCDADMQCQYYSSRLCQPRAVDLCLDIYETKTACDARGGSRCVWGPICSGSADGCSRMTNATSCTANIGCKWTPR